MAWVILLRQSAASSWAFVNLGVFDDITVKALS
jgi:hypothetical protein